MVKILYKLDLKCCKMESLSRNRGQLSTGFPAPARHASMLSLRCWELLHSSGQSQIGCNTNKGGKERSSLERAANNT